MALQQNFSRDVFGEQTLFEDCYFRIGAIHHYSKDEGLEFSVLVYRNKSVSDIRGNIIDAIHIRADYNPNNKEDALAECYNHLKRLPEFKGAIDC